MDDGLWRRSGRDDESGWKYDSDAPSRAGDRFVLGKSSDDHGGSIEHIGVERNWNRCDANNRQWGRDGYGIVQSSFARTNYDLHFDGEQQRRKRNVESNDYGESKAGRRGLNAAIRADYHIVLSKERYGSRPGVEHKFRQRRSYGISDYAKWIAIRDGIGDDAVVCQHQREPEHDLHIHGEGI